MTETSMMSTLKEERPSVDCSFYPTQKLKKEKKNKFDGRLESKIRKENDDTDFTNKTASRYPTVVQWIKLNIVSVFLSFVSAIHRFLLLLPTSSKFGGRFIILAEPIRYTSTFS